MENDTPLRMTRPPKLFRRSLALRRVNAAPVLEGHEARTSLSHSRRIAGLCALGHTPSARSRAQAGAGGRDRRLRGAVEVLLGTPPPPPPPGVPDLDSGGNQGGLRATASALSSPVFASRFSAAVVPSMRRRLISTSESRPVHWPSMRTLSAVPPPAPGASRPRLDSSMTPDVLARKLARLKTLIADLAPHSGKSVDQVAHDRYEIERILSKSLCHPERSEGSVPGDRSIKCRSLTKPVLSEVEGFGMTREAWKSLRSSQGAGSPSIRRETG